MEDKVKRAGRLMYEEFQNNVPFSMLDPPFSDPEISSILRADLSLQSSDLN